VHKVANLGIASALASAAAIGGVLAGGSWSDRTTGRWGRRAPWLVVSAILSAVLMMGLIGAASFALVAALYAALWFSTNLYQGVLTAVLPDRVPAERRGVASSVLGMGIPVGLLIGVNFASRAGAFPAYMGLAAFLVLTTGGMLLFAPERPVQVVVKEPRRPNISWPATANTYFASFRSLDFALAFAGRALMFFSIYSVNGYTFYTLQDRVGSANLPGHNPQVAVAILLSINMAGCIASIATSGWLVHRWPRPKFIVGATSIGIAVAMLIPIFSPSWLAMVLLHACLGLFLGSFLAIDLALMSLVLPDRDAEGRDMAILQVATSAAQVLSPAAAATVIAMAGYPSLFLLAGVTALAAGVVVFFIKRVP
jgi:MFS family permease